MSEPSEKRRRFDQAVLETLVMLRGRVPERQLSQVIGAYAELYPDDDRLKEVYGEEALS